MLSERVAQILSESSYPALQSLSGKALGSFQTRGLTLALPLWTLVTAMRVSGNTAAMGVHDSHAEVHVCAYECALAWG